MSHSSDPDQPARRRTTAVVVLAVLLAVVGGVLSITPTTGTASAWAEPPLELPVPAPDEAVAPPVARPAAAHRVTAETGSEAPTPADARPQRTTARQAASTTVGDAPPPGRSPPPA
ncbi:MAG: hypothetical protein ABW195_14780 [Ilumatobacteraceae bacterium]